MRVYCSTPLSSWPARTKRSPSALALFQSRGCARTSAVLVDGCVHLALPQGLFRPLQCPFAIEWRGTMPRPQSESIKQRRRLERPPVCLGITMLRDRREVRRGGVPLVPIEAIPGIGPMEVVHQPVAGDLGDDRRRGDGRRTRSPSHHGTLRHPQALDPEGIDQHEVGLGARASTARAMARNDARWMLIGRFREGLQCRPPRRGTGRIIEDAGARAPPRSAAWNRPDRGCGGRGRAPPPRP